ncbi:hypothetical protein HN662_05035 [Candidatus Woesearchaeota archaeon]|nr:hypothetical protein [Candidatus Woesearchaeota archaeon]
MKVILSRKGFDSGYGGYPSLILPDCKLISLPIPSKDSTRYSDLKLNKQQTYFDLMKEIKPAIKYNKQWHELTKDTECHLDPDIYTSVLERSKEWKACFGQVGGSQTHLMNQNVKEGDLFLFFGWFKQTRLKDKTLCFDKLAHDLHVIFGYFQIGEIIHTNQQTQISKWLKSHPHMLEKYNNKKQNTIYIARNTLTWNDKLPGAGTFKFNQDLVLTKKGFSRSRWKLSDFFENVNISHHSKKSWKHEGYFQSAGIGQEFVIEDNVLIENWAKNLIKNNTV